MRYFRELHHWAMPAHLAVESTNRCNLRCTHCHQSQFQILHGDFDTAMFYSLINELDTSTSVSLSSMGEPLVAAAFKDFFEHLLSKGHRTAFITNGQLLDSCLEMLIGRDVSVTLSMDGFDDEIYKSVRGISNKKVIDTIRRLRKLKEAAGTDKPSLSITMILSRKNIEDLPAMVAWMHESGADRLVAYHQVFYMNNPDNQFQAQSLFFHQELSDRIHAKAISLAKELGVSFLHTPLFDLRLRKDDQSVLSSYISPDKKNCSWFEKEAIVGWHGTVFGCCSFDRLFMGSLKHNSFRDIWNGPLYRESRLQFINGTPPDLCYSHCVAMQTIDNTREAFFRILVDEEKLQTAELAGPLSYSFSNVNAQYKEAVELFENSHDAQALEVLLLLLETDHNFFEACHLIALIHQRQGRQDLADTFFQRAEAVCRNYQGMM